jgi:multiple sugar transport system substrate-binding protein
MAHDGVLGNTLTRRALLKRTGLVGAGLVGASGLGTTLAGCGSSSGGSSSGVKTITLAISGTNAVTKKNWNATFAEFNKANPKIKIQGLFVNANGWVDFFSALQTQLAGGTAVDAIYIPTEGMQLFAKRGLINPLDDYVAKDKSYINALYQDIDQSMLKGFKAHSNPGGKTYYVPYAYNTTCIAYNKKTFASRKVDPPKPDWNWDDFKTVCQSVSNKAKRQYGFLISADVWGGFEPWLTTNGAKLLNDSWTKSAIKSPETVEAFAYCRSLVSDGLAPAPSTTANGLQLLASGSVAMVLVGAIAESTLAQYGMHTSDLQIVPWPKKQQQGASIGVGSIAMLQSSKEKDAVWTFIKYVTAPQQQKAGRGGTITDGQLPIRDSASKSEVLLKQMPDGAEYFWKMLPYAQFVPGTANATAMEGAMIQTWSDMLTGSISPSAAAKQMESQIKKNI